MSDERKQLPYKYEECACYTRLLHGHGATLEYALELFSRPGIVLKNIQHLAGTRACYTYFIVLAL
jgi:hypothetical protein